MTTNTTTTSPSTKYQLYIYLSKNQDDAEWVERYRQKVRDHNQKIQDAAATATTADSGFDLFMPNDGADYGYGIDNLISRQFITNPGITSSAGVDGARGLNLGVRCCMRVTAASAASATPPTMTTTTTTTTLLAATATAATPAATATAAPQPVSISTTTSTPSTPVPDLPSGFYLYPRSSISKTRMRLANSVGIIDAGYRGDIIAAVDTIGIFGSNDIWHVWKETLSPIQKYDRYFQLCAPDLSAFLVHIVDTEAELGAPTIRGQGGFGSTGV
jgi:dUTPase